MLRDVNTFHAHVEEFINVTNQDERHILKESVSSGELWAYWLSLGFKSPSQQSGSSPQSVEACSSPGEEGTEA